MKHTETCASRKFNVCDCDGVIDTPPTQTPTSDALRNEHIAAMNNAELSIGCAYESMYLKAQTLELELIQAQQGLNDWQDIAAQAQRERDEAREEVESWKQYVHNDTTELSQLRNAVDELVKAVTSSKFSHVICNCDYGCDGRLPLQGELCDWHKALTLANNLPHRKDK
jgi:hypothetical protein